MKLDRVLWELKQLLTIDPKPCDDPVVDVGCGGSPYAYRFFRPDDLDEDGRLAGDEFADAELIEVRVFFTGEYTLTPTDAAGRHTAAPHPPQLTDAVPMVIGQSGVAMPSVLKHPIPDEPPVADQIPDDLVEDIEEAIEAEEVSSKEKRRLRKLLLG